MPTPTANATVREKVIAPFERRDRLTERYGPEIAA